MSWNYISMRNSIKYDQPQRRIINVEHRNWVNQQRAEKK